MKKQKQPTVTPSDLIYHIKPRTTPFGHRFGSFLKSKRIGTAGVYRIGQVFGGRIAMY
jgi:hypothetical protein